MVEAVDLKDASALLAGNEDIGLPCPAGQPATGQQEDTDRVFARQGRLNLLERPVDRQLSVVREAQGVFDPTGRLAPDAPRMVSRLSA